MDVLYTQSPTQDGGMAVERPLAVTNCPMEWEGNQDVAWLSQSAVLQRGLWKERGPSKVKAAGPRMEGLGAPKSREQPRV